MAKLVVRANTREECQNRLRRALAEYVIDGVKTSIPLHEWLLDQGAVQTGDYSIKWLEQALENLRLNPHTPLRAYTTGAFPMADSRDGTRIGFYEPKARGLFDLAHIHVPRRLARLLRGQSPQFAIDRDFAAIIRACAVSKRAHEDSTWINQEIERVFNQLHTMGHAHCLGAYDEDGALSWRPLRPAYRGMFLGRACSPIHAHCQQGLLCRPMCRLKGTGWFQPHIDAQMDNPHLRQFGLTNLACNDWFRALVASLF